MRTRACLVIAGLTTSLLLSAPLPASETSPRAQAAKAPVARYRVVKSYPHDSEAFTQGLIYLDGGLYEGTGLVGRSSIRKVRLENGEILQMRNIDPPIFGEGITEWGKTLVQLTWQSGVGFVYDRASFQPLKTFNYTGEGWGLTHDDKRLIMSDGTSTLRFLDPATLRHIGRLPIRDGTAPVNRLNELEFVKGEILANIWTTDRIARISPRTGQVVGWIDLSGLMNARNLAQGAMLNGIAYDAAGDRLFVTGKLWPRLFEIKILQPTETGR
jgi:glutamine cyclotransferase